MSAEEFAAETVRRVLDIDTEVWDVHPKQGAYDVRLTYPDGRVGALEVTSHSGQGQRQLESLLSDDDFGWPLPGNWWWSIQLTDPRELPALRAHYREIILACEAHGVVRPDQLSRPALSSDAYRVCGAVDFLGHPDVPAREGGGRPRRAAVLPAGSGGWVDRELTTLHDELLTVLAVPSVARRADKVIATCESEAHLFLALDTGALPFPTFYGLAFEDRLPLEAPAVPAGLTHLWLVPRYGGRTLLWDGRAWTDHRPFD